MSIIEYQRKALTTALPTALTLDYLLPSLLSETYEYASKVLGAEAKEHRDGVRPAVEKELSEIGDIAWHIVVTAKVLDIPVTALIGVKSRISSSRVGAATLVYDAIALREVLSMEVPHIGYDENYLSDMWETIAAMAEQVYKVDLDDILQANLDKLSDRKARGVISGSGDNR